MKNPDKIPDRIICSGPQQVMRTQAYTQQVDKIKRELNATYAAAIKGEKNPVKRLLLRYKKRLELHKAIRKLTSLQNLYLAVKT